MNADVNIVSIPYREGSIRAKHSDIKNPKFGLILGHGAGGGMDTPFMQYYLSRLSSLGICVTEFNFRYKESGRKAPAPRAQLEAEYRTVIEYALAEIYPDIPIFVGGKSMGGRISSYIAGEYSRVIGLVFLGYPLHPPAKPGTERAEHLYALQKPLLFVSGSKDSLAKLDLLQDTITRLDEFGHLFLIEEGDHSLKVPKKSPLTTEQVWNRCCGEILNWIERIQERS